MKTTSSPEPAQLFSLLHGYLFLILSLCLISPVSAQTSGDEKSAFQHELSYAHEFVSNMRGGMKTGNEHLGMANLRLMINPDYATLWSGGRIFVNTAMTLGGTPAGSLTGDFHGLSNIEAGKLIYIHELWYQHRFGTTIITAGLQDLNKEFLVSDNSGLLINSTFGVPAPLAGLASMPIFPHTTLGAAIQHRISESLHIQSALYDGSPDDYENKEFNLNWKISRKDGYTSISEIHYVAGDQEGSTTSLKAGYLVHASANHNEESGDILRTASIYLIADHSIYLSPGGALAGLFLQGAVDPGNSDRYYSYVGAGFTLTSLFANRPDDVLSFGYANSSVEGAETIRESILELAWRFSLTQQLFIQPDVQYIINPGCTSEKLGNALVFLVRAGVSF